jgi:hypothetical protein
VLGTKDTTVRLCDGLGCRSDRAETSKDNVGNTSGQCRRRGVVGGEDGDRQAGRDPQCCTQVHQTRHHRVEGKTIVMMKRRIARFSLVALSTFVAGAVTVAWSLKQELAELADLAEQNESRG